MKIRIVMSALLLTMGTISHGQAIPAGSTSMSPSNVGPNLSNLDGVLHYSLSASEIIQFGYYGNGDVTESTALSGNVAYTAKSTTRPFSLIFAGGVILPNAQYQGTSTFWNVAASQGYVTRSWVFNVSDSFSFLPQSPTTGLSGIPGVGDLGSTPVQGPVQGPAGGVFSNAGNRYANTLSGSVERQINHNTSISGFGSWSVLSFLDNNTNSGNLDSTQVSGVVSVNRHIDARSSASINANYSTVTYSGTNTTTVTSNPDIELRGISLSYQRVLSRRLSMSVSGGPQWVSSANSVLIPDSLNAAVSASLSYSRGSTSASVGYSHGVNAGSGVLPGALSDSVYGSVGHTYGRKWVASATGGYTHSSGLTLLSATTGSAAVPTHETYNTIFGGGQVTRGFSTHFSGYVSYEAQKQTNNYGLGAQNALNGTSQTLGIGVTFTPRSTRLGQF